jgi:hypothetical protein
MEVALERSVAENANAQLIFSYLMTFCNCTDYVELNNKDLWMMDELEGIWKGLWPILRQYLPTTCQFRKIMKNINRTADLWIKIQTQDFVNAKQ